MKKNKKNNLVINSIMMRILIKTMICIVVYLSFLIIVKYDNKYYSYIYDFVYNKSFSFSKFNTWYKNTFGSIFIENNNIDYVPVSNEVLAYKSLEEYKDGVILDVSDNYIVPILNDGFVVFKGNKNGYENVIIIENNGFETWYCNVSSTNIDIYEYVKKGDYLGEVNNNKLILLFYNDGKKEDYKKYI